MTTASRRPSAWVLNFDAERELEDPNARTSSEASLARMLGLVDQLGGLVGPDDVILGENGAARTLDARNYAGRCWCPTKSALDAIRARGLTPTRTPSFDVLRTANHRKFCAELGQTLPLARYVHHEDELRHAITMESPTKQWLLKKPFGFAGRGRRRVAQGRLETAAEPWVRAALSAGEGLQVEPWVTRTTDRASDFALHGYLCEEGSLTLGRPTQQECDRNGAWRTTHVASDLKAYEEESLFGALEDVASALHRMSYFGPFGVDAYRYHYQGRVAWNPRSEINARYSMGWATGMGQRRPDLDALDV